MKSFRLEKTSASAWWWLLVVALAALGLGVIGYHRTHHGQPDRSYSIQATIGADSCSSSSFQIVSKINDEKDTIYNCDMPSGKTICVTEANGIDSNVTATVRLLFANTLGSGKPTCIS